MTVRDVLAVAVEQLRGITVPVDLVESIGIPVATAVANLKMCIEGIDKAAEEEKENGVEL